MPDDIARPITIYVSRFEFENISIEYLQHRRVSVIDVEMGYQDAEKLLKYLQQRLAAETPGGMRVRIYGNLVIS